MPANSVRKQQVRLLRDSSWVLEAGKGFWIDAVMVKPPGIKPANVTCRLADCRNEKK